MKHLKKLSCAVIAIISLTAFSVNSFKETSKTSACKAASKSYTPFYYNLSTRFLPIPKSQLAKAKSIFDLAKEENEDLVFKYESVSVILIDKDVRTQTKATGNNASLNETQIKLLKQFDYSTDFVIQADYLERNTATGKLTFNYFSPHLTVVPENQAYYETGKESLINYLEKENKENTLQLDERKLQPASIRFTVSKKGTLANITIERSCGFSRIDTHMLELLKNAPGKWIPAKNINGENVNQELMMFYGKVGC